MMPTAFADKLLHSCCYDNGYTTIELRRSWRPASLSLSTPYSEGLRVSSPPLGGQIGVWGVAEGLGGSDWGVGGQIGAGLARGSDWAWRVPTGLSMGS